MPKDADLRRAADVLNAGEKVAMLVGAGALQATDEVIEVADILGAGVAKALLGKAVIPDDLPFCTGPIGLLGSKPSWDMMEECDTLLMIGSSFPYSEFLPKEEPPVATLKHVNGNVLVSGETGLASGDEATRVAKGARVITTANSEVTVVYDNGCEVKLKPNQRLRMLINHGKRPLRFSAGVAWASFELAKTGPRYRAGLEFFDAEADAVQKFCEAKKK